MKTTKFIVKVMGYYVYKVLPLPPKSLRNKNKWLFGSHTGWNSSSNAKYLFLQLKREDLSIDAIWIARNRNECRQVRELGYKCYKWYSIPGIYHCLSAGIYIYTATASDIIRMTSRTAFCVDLCHGVGRKKIRGLDTNFYRHNYKFRREPASDSFLHRNMVSLNFYRKPDFVLAPSRYQSSLFAAAFQIPESNIVLAGYPRNEIFFWPKERIREYIERHCPNELEFFNTLVDKTYRKVYIYMPTWRRWNNGGLLSMAGFDLDRLENILEEKDSLFIIKLHKLDKSKIDMKRCKRIACFSYNNDVYPLLPFTDCLITDYSSIYYDYILMDKEIVLFPFDLKEYETNSYDLENYESFCPGKRVYTFDGLFSLIRDETDCHLLREERSEVLHLNQECHGNGLNLIREIKNRYNQFLCK